MTDSTKDALPSSLVILDRTTTDAATFHQSVWGRVFNHRRDARLSSATCRPRSAAQVAAAVRHARDRGCRVSVRSGGHSWAAWSVREGALLVDLADLDVEDGAEAEMRDNAAVEGGGKAAGRGRIEYDEKTEVVACAPSTTGKVLNAYLEKRGRMFAGGHCPDVGLGGFLLQGGMGWNCKNWGWACESVVGVDVVTADAEQRHCSAEENSDLFWAARGAGPGFPAIVTRFYLKTRQLLEMYQSLYIFPISEYEAVMKWVIEICPTADPDTEMVAVSSYLPGDDTLTILANFTTFKLNHTAAEAALRPLHASLPIGLVPRDAFFCQPTSLDKEYCAQAAANPHGHRYCSENAYVRDDLPALRVADVLRQGFTTPPTKLSFALYFAMNPTSRRKLDSGEGGMALSLQSDHYFALYTVWKEEADDERCEGWVREVMKGVERHAVGSYLGDADFRARRTKYWSKEAGERLREVRRKWDSEGRICGYLDDGDRSGVDGLQNEFEWQQEQLPT